jgi:beta-lactamase regulating signal transducer with metallopeptidase domain
MGVQAPEAVSASAVFPPAAETLSPLPLTKADWLLAAYAIPAALLLAILFCAIVRLRFLRVRARAPADPRWLSAMADAERKMNVRPGVGLLVSDELTSPISWGIARPVIVLTEHSYADVEKAHALILHEMAHVARFDWAKLVLARVATAIFWFNPLVWALARHCHELREEAADDAVLRTNFSGADYAALLMSAVAYENKGGFTMANNISPKKGSVRRRVLRALDQGRSRMPARPAWTASCCAAIGAASVSLSAANPVFAYAVPVAAEAPMAEPSAVTLPAAAAAEVPPTQIAGAPTPRKASRVVKGPGVMTYQDPVTGKTIHHAPKGQGVVTYRDPVTGEAGVRLATEEELAKLQADVTEHTAIVARAEVTIANAAKARAGMAVPAGAEATRAEAAKTRAGAETTRAQLAAAAARRVAVASAKPRGPGRLVPRAQGPVTITGDASMVVLPNGDVMVYDAIPTN